MKGFLQAAGCILALVLTVGGCSALANSDHSPSEHQSRYGGSPTVFAEIDTSTDCASLQETFDRNMTRYEMMSPSVRTQEGSMGQVLKGYWTAADDRMDEIGCY